MIVKHHHGKLTLVYGSKTILNYNIHSTLGRHQEGFPKLQDQLLISALKAIQMVVDA
jgi:hypothetical protein